MKLVERKSKRHSDDSGCNNSDIISAKSGLDAISVDSDDIAIESNDEVGGNKNINESDASDAGEADGK